MMNFEELVDRWYMNWRSFAKVDEKIEKIREVAKKYGIEVKDEQINIYNYEADVSVEISVYNILNEKPKQKIEAIVEYIMNPLVYNDSTINGISIYITTYMPPKKEALTDYELEASKRAKAIGLEYIRSVYNNADEQEHLFLIENGNDVYVLLKVYSS